MALLLGPGGPGFVETDNMTAEAISAKILEVLEPLQLDPELCVGFGFDGASRGGFCYGRSGQSARAQPVKGRTTTIWVFLVPTIFS